MATLALVAAALGDRAVAEEAGLATVMIAEKMEGGDKDDLRAAEELEKFLAKYPARKEEAEARALLASIRNRNR